jgi:hypothetical protein
LVLEVPFALREPVAAFLALSCPVLVEFLRDREPSSQLFVCWEEKRV